MFIRGDTHEVQLFGLQWQWPAFLMLTIRWIHLSFAGSLNVTAHEKLINSQFESGVLEPESFTLFVRHDSNVPFSSFSQAAAYSGSEEWKFHYSCRETSFCAGSNSTSWCQLGHLLSFSLSPWPVSWTQAAARDTEEHALLPASMGSSLSPGSCLQGLLVQEALVCCNWSYACVSCYFIHFT